MDLLTYTQTVQALTHVPASVQEQLLAAYSVPTVQIEQLLSDATELNTKLAAFDEKEKQILQEMSVFIKQTEQKMVVLERTHAEHTEHEQEMHAAESLLSM